MRTSGRLLELPGLEDMEYDPAGVYLALTRGGKPKRHHPGLA